MDGTAIGDRMKRYEQVPWTVLTPNMPMIIRVDGRAFHTYTRQFKHRDESPWSPSIRAGMTAAAQALMAEIAGSKLAYIQSDEISILATDYDTEKTMPWFGGVAQKIISASAATATAEFNQTMLALEMGRQTVNVNRAGRHTFTIDFPDLATFDSRCFVLPQNDVCNYFIWRQRDAEKNSVAMLAQSHFTHKQLQGLNGNQMQDLLMKEFGINWNDCETWQKRGWCVKRDSVEMTLREYEEQQGHGTTRPPHIKVDLDRIVRRTKIRPDWDIPIFTKDRSYVDRFVFLTREKAA